jgi:hypothetical protein
MLWQQQWSRRESLSSLANLSASTALSRMLVHYIAGVPAPILEFAQNINSDQGPSAELRAVYGGSITALINALLPIYALSHELGRFARRPSGLQAAASTEHPHAVANAARALRNAADVYAGDLRGFVDVLDVAVTCTSFSIEAGNLSPVAA